MAEFTTAFGQDGPEITKPSSAMFLTTCAVCAKALNNDTKNYEKALAKAKKALAEKNSA